MLSILIAEDEKPIREGLDDLLSENGYRTFCAANGRAALEIYASQKIDLALLDIMMPEKSGYDVCREIRKTDDLLPIIFLTAKEEEIDKVVGLELGADDYIVKPFGIHELLARIKSVLRRSGRQAGSPGSGEAMPAVFPFGEGEVNTREFTFSSNGTRTELTHRELSLLEFFYARKGEVVSRETLLNEIWGLEYTGTTRTLDQHMAKLRQKIEKDPGRSRHLQTVHGVGYRYLI